MKKNRKEISLDRQVKIDPKESQNRRDLMATMAEKACTWKVAAVKK